MCDAVLVEQRVVEEDTGRSRAAATVHASLSVYAFELGRRALNLRPQRARPDV